MKDKAKGREFAAWLRPCSASRVFTPVGLLVVLLAILASLEILHLFILLPSRIEHIEFVSIKGGDMTGVSGELRCPTMDMWHCEMGAKRHECVAEFNESYRACCTGVSHA